MWDLLLRDGLELPTPKWERNSSQNKDACFICLCTPNDVVVRKFILSRLKSLLSDLKLSEMGIHCTRYLLSPRGQSVCLSLSWTVLPSKHPEKSSSRSASECNQMPKPQNFSRNRILVSWPALLLNLNMIQHVSIFAHMVHSPYTCVNPTEVMYKGSGSKAVIEKVHVSLTFWYSLKILH